MTPMTRNQVARSFGHQSPGLQRGGWAAEARLRNSDDVGSVAEALGRGGPDGRGSAIDARGEHEIDAAYRFLETAACSRSCGVLAPLTSRRA